MGRLSVEPLIPASLWLLLAVAAAVLLVWYGLSRPGRLPASRWAVIVALMSVSVAGVLVILLNPTWIDPIHPPAGKPLLTVLVDTSASMSTGDADGRSRFDAAREAASSMAGRLGGRFDVRLRTFAADVVPAEASELASRQPAGELTDLGGAVAVSLQEDRPQGQALVLLSDGIDTAGDGVREVLGAVRLARAMATPIYTRTLGRSDEADLCDLSAEARSPQQLAYLGQKIVLATRVHQRGGVGTRINVVLSHEGLDLDRQELLLGTDESGEARFEVSQDKPGLYRYEVRVEPRPNEVTDANNSTLFMLHVVDEPIRVLLVEGKPYWDGKFLMRTLASDPAVELDSVVRLTQGRLLRRALGAKLPATQPASAAESLGGTNVATTAPAEPTKAERWKIITSAADVFGHADLLESYQIVVLGRDAEEFLTEEGVNNLRQWIARQGGALVCYRGAPTALMSQRLGRLLPVQWTAGHESRFHVKLTEYGRDLRWLADWQQDMQADVLSQLPTLATVAQVEKPKPLAIVLATAMSAAGNEEWPVVSYQPYGTGRVVVIEGAGMWRWAFLPPQNETYHDVYAALWHSLLRWLISGTGLLPGQTMDLRTDRVSFHSNEVASATLLMREEALKGVAPTIELRHQGDAKAEVFSPVPAGEEPGVFRVVFGKLTEARYEARVVNNRAAGNDAVGKDTAAVPAARFDVRRPLREQLERRARPDLMARVAEDSGGAVLTSASAGEVSSLFESHLKRNQPERVRRTTAWDRWWVLAGAVAIWCTAWMLRRSGGLV